LQIPPKESAIFSPSKIAPQKPSKPKGSTTSVEDKSRRILDRLIPLLRYLKSDSKGNAPQPSSSQVSPQHKKSFSVSQQKFKDYSNFGKLSKEPIVGKKKKSAAEYPTLDELLSQKDPPFSYLSVGQSLAWSSQEEDSIASKPSQQQIQSNSKITNHNRTKSNHTKISNISKDSKKDSIKVLKPAINIEEQYKQQAKLLQHPKEETRKKTSESIRKKASVTTPPSPARQQKINDVRKVKVPTVNATHIDHESTKLVKRKPSVNETVQKILVNHKRSASDGAKVFVNAQNNQKTKTGENTNRAKENSNNPITKKPQSSERSVTNNANYEEHQNTKYIENIASNQKRCVSSAGVFNMSAKRSSACAITGAIELDKKRLTPSIGLVGTKKSSGQVTLAMGYAKDSALIKKTKINALVQQINVNKAVAPCNTFIDADQIESSVIGNYKTSKKMIDTTAICQSNFPSGSKLIIKSGLASPIPLDITDSVKDSKSGTNTTVSKYKLYENFPKHKKDLPSGAISPPPPPKASSTKFHKQTASVSIPKVEAQSSKLVSSKIQEVKQIPQKPSVPKTTTPTPLMSGSNKRVLSSVPGSKGPSAAPSPEPEKRLSGDDEKPIKMVPSKAIVIKKIKKTSEPVPTVPKVVPLSKENIEKLQRIKDGEALAEYIKGYFKEHKEAPPTTTEFYRVGRLLGKGAFGKVNLGMHKLTGKLVAIKSINKEYLTDEASKKKVMQEYSILKHLRHPNVIRLYESFESVKHILIVTELCTGGDLLNYVRKRRKLKEDMAKFVFKRLIEGLNHCHTRGILHRDIKLDNVLLNSTGELKICDFGVSKIVHKGERMTEQCGTPAYIAPEILRDRGYEGFEVDIWSAGVALYAMLYGTVPFKANNMKELHKLIMKGRYTLKEDASKEAKDLLTKMLEIDPYKRITISEIFAHEWMQGIDETISLFSEQEKELLSKEYCYNKSKPKGEGETNTLFTEQNIDSTQNELTKNNTTKSVILAPFNSTRTDQETSKDFIEKDVVVKEKKEVLKFAGKVRDIDRQYEKNNNGDVDNGVYNKFVCDSSEDNKNNGSKEVSSVENSISESIDNPHMGKEDSDSPMENSSNRMDKYKGKFNKSTESTMPYTTAQSVIIDQDTLTKMESYGYPKEYVKKCLNDNELNHATATYYLLTNHYL